MREDRRAPEVEAEEQETPAPEPAPEERGGRPQGHVERAVVRPPERR